MQKILIQSLTLLCAAITLLTAGREFFYNRKSTGLLLLGTTILLATAAALQS